jgi:SWI/SNF-related matrix-associated actin-dependent regulator of chromatin subfamily A3
MNVATTTAAGTAKDSSSTMAQGPLPTSTAASVTQPPEDLEEEVLEADDEDNDDDELELLGTISTDTGKNCQIVGIRYYSGKAHPGEYVHLAREPSNPYDRNAIR